MPPYQYANYIRRTYKFMESNLDLFSRDIDVNLFIEKLSTMETKEKEERVNDILNFVADIGLLVQNSIKDSEIHKQVFSADDFDKIKKKGAVDLNQIRSILKAILPVSSRLNEVKELDSFKRGDVGWNFTTLTIKLIDLVNSSLPDIRVPNILTSVVNDSDYLEGSCESNIMNFCAGLTQEVDLAQEDFNPIQLPIHIINSLKKILEARAYNKQFYKPSSSRENEAFLKALLVRLESCCENLQFMNDFNIDFADYSTTIHQYIKCIEIELSALVCIVRNKKSIPLNTEKLTSHSLFRYIPKTMQDSTIARKNNPQIIEQIYTIIEEIKSLIATPKLGLH